MKAATIEFLRQRFADYYQTAPLSAPPSVEQREWAFVLFDPGYPEIRMRRHIGYPNKAELLRIHPERGPCPPVLFIGILWHAPCTHHGRERMAWRRSHL